MRKQTKFWTDLLRSVIRYAGLTAIGLALASPVLAAELVRGEPLQGGLVVFKTDPDTAVTLDGEPLEISLTGYFAVGFHRDDDAPVTVNMQLPDGQTDQLVLSPQRRRYDIQRIDNLPTSMVTPPEETLVRIRQDIADVKAARAVFSAQDDALINGFDWPVWGRISGIYGSQRILNGKPRQPHYGIDIAAAPGLAVTAPADGQVVMAKDLYFTGGTIILDHGYHLNSTYSHLQEMIVSVGSYVKRGDIIGSVGSTGRSTGPHLDWRINWNQKRLDPLLLAGPLLPALPVQRPKNLF